MRQMINFKFCFAAARAEPRFSNEGWTSMRPPTPGTNNVFVSHKPNIMDAFGKDWFDVSEGEASPSSRTAIAAIQWSRASRLATGPSWLRRATDPAGSYWASLKGGVRYSLSRPLRPNSLGVPICLAPLFTGRRWPPFQDNLRVSYVGFRTDGSAADL